ncbi:predicted protein [Postia placenta Mad-698-R]|uniref:DUF4939 domain-containing protein n=1 Tax=Postia placenta MAD-698-R-SB12 TaxID=670580 RepID=A0A1X6N065_9APHY|nr:hypothetical protein POSPLADRAFT_1145133 [Postia placenta MAD-698-R-SB12]EED83536.1 predicted protein [Postia placenta Mad-698-R]OSX61880.1 hypothetical protein POSPLADRAFT_1145133 [Postia placenta MAD-698-R-SB12]
MSLTFCDGLQMRTGRSVGGRSGSAGFEGGGGICSLGCVSMLRTDQLRTDQCTQPALISPCIQAGLCCPRDLSFDLLSLDHTGPHVNCEPQGLLGHRSDLIDVYIPDGPKTVIYRCEQQPCPNRTPQLIAEDYPRYKVIRRAQHLLSPRSTLASRSASQHSCPVSPTSRLPQTVAESSQVREDLPPDPAPEPEPEEGVGEEGISESESEDSVGSASPTALAPASAVPDSDQWRATTAASAPQHPPSPPMPVMSSPTTAPNKETLKLLLPLRYDGKTVIECDRFLSQLRIYWLINTSLMTIELKVQVALSLLDGDACAWATPYFAQLALVQMGVQKVTTPFRNEAAFTAAFKACFGNLDDAAAAQVELMKLCADKSVREKCTAAEFSALFKGPADRSGYGDLELCDKYLSGIPSRVYCKIELETFTTWRAAEK